MRLSSLILVGITLSSMAYGPWCAADFPKTVAETSDYAATSRHADVVAFCEQLAKASPLVRLGELGTSHEGRKLPLLVIADPPVATAEEARHSGKLIVFAMGNIHAGEVDGKEALLMLARDLVATPERSLFKELVFVFAPIFNADGNEKFGNNRRAQAGPPEVGVRANSQGFDLNRDFVKLESPEVRSLVKFFNEWDPAVFIDMHTTNGSYHRYTITYEGGRCLAGDPRVVAFVRDDLLPEVGRRMEKETGYRSFFYGNFAPRDGTRSQWLTVPATPRYGVHYFGLRNGIGILSESYSYAPFKDRVLAGKAFVKNITGYLAENRAAIERLLKDARLATSTPSETEIVLRSEAAPHGRPVKILGFVEEMRDNRRRPTSETKDYEVLYLGTAKPTLTVRRPLAYVLPATLAKVADQLRLHGIVVDTLPAPATLEVETYRVDKIERGELYEKHQAVTLQVTPANDTVAHPTGTLVVRIAQPLGALAAYLLEPQSADGLTTWNFFDDVLKEGEPFPVARVMKPLAK